MILRITGFNEGVCRRTGKRYRWTGELWAPIFSELPQEVRASLYERGLDIERLYAEFQAEIRLCPPDRLLEDLALAPVLPLHEIDSLANANDTRATDWKHKRRRGQPVFKVGTGIVAEPLPVGKRHRHPCRGCGGALDAATPGCSACASRHAARRKRLAA